ncbi:GntR family transcriptional regulator [Vitreoscilla filiformis]|uniref:Putative 8-amino-7-oxononanoate synthase n=2 Tax=Vitreoscilla filiformis TaxID=63 RepID=A0A221KA13_VITFI|nr:GntR family transcriptional regulator [Vitreoscilla filiformis]
MGGKNGREGNMPGIVPTRHLIRKMQFSAKSTGSVAPAMHRYEQLAAEWAEGIERGTLRPGERLPSVRQTCQARAVSPSTVFQAYAVLEERGWVEARPRSGYYVRARPSRPGPPPITPPPDTGPHPVAISELLVELLGSTRDAEVVPLGSAFPAPELFPFEALARCGARAMRRLKPAHITGALTAGDEGLREALRHRYAVQGVALHPEELIITHGAMEALNLCLQAVTQPGDVVVVESPAFYGALQALERLHLRALEVATHPQDGVDLTALETLLQRERVAACWFMTRFQNPLGALMPTERKQALVTLLARHGIPLIEDDVYGELYASAERPPPAKAFDGAGLVLHCSSFSKCLAPGYRVGWAAAGRFGATVARLKMMSSLSTSLPAQRAIADYLQQGGYDRHLRHLRHALAESQRRALAVIDESFPPGTHPTRPQGGYFLWLELPPQVNALALHQRALRHGISVAPGVLFSADARFTHHLRLNVGHPGDARLEPALRWLGAEVA